VNPRSRTFSDGDIELYIPRIVMGEEVSFDRLCGDPNQINCVLAWLSLSLRDDIQHSKSLAQSWKPFTVNASS